MPVDLAELRRLHEAATTRGAWVQEQRLLNWTIRRDLPSLLDRLEALEVENARLRGALERVAALDSLDLAFSADKRWEVLEIAREALGK